MALSGGKRRQNFNEINITPLTDVFLVLLVIMFLIAPLLDNQAALKIDPPAAQSAKTADPAQVESVLIELSKEGLVAVNGNSIANENIKNKDLRDLVYKSLKKINSLDLEKKPLVKLKADQEVSYGRFVTVVDAINQAQLGKLSLITTIPVDES